MLKLVLDDYVVGMFEFGKVYNAYIYNEDETAFNSSGYTVIVWVLDENGNAIMQPITPTKVTDNPAVWQFSFTVTNRLSNAAFFEVFLEFSQANVQIPTRRARIVCTPAVGTL